jgi:hypothetical protein
MAARASWKKEKKKNTIDDIDNPFELRLNLNSTSLVII